MSIEVGVEVEALQLYRKLLVCEAYKTIHKLTVCATETPSGYKPRLP